MKTIKELKKELNRFPQDSVFCAYEGEDMGISIYSGDRMTYLGFISNKGGDKDNKTPDPVFNDDEGWWFCDETWADRLGPFDSEKQARDKLKDYVKRLHEDEEDTSDMNKNQIKILKETPIKYVDMEVEMGDNAKKLLLEYALENIKNDENALISWAAADILKKQTERTEKTLEVINALKSAEGSTKRAFDLLMNYVGAEGYSSGMGMIDGIAAIRKWIEELESQITFNDKNEHE